MPQVSAELRWFAPAERDAGLDPLGTWFKSGDVPPGGGARSRQDVYLADDSGDELGIKNREGKSGLEVKCLIEPGFLSLEVGRRRSTAQLWSKVTSKVLTLPAAAAATRTTHKTRWLRKFNTASGAAIELPLGLGPFGEDPLEGAPPDVGCNVEWTIIELPGVDSKWVTFGLEAFAFGQTESIFTSLAESLRTTVVALNATIPDALTTAAWREQSYPAWLGGLSR